MGAAPTTPSASSATTDWVDSSWYTVDRTDDVSREAAIEALLNSGELTPELILQLAQTRLDDLDSQIRDIMDAMSATTERARAAGEHLNGLRDIMTAIAPAMNPDGTLALGRDRHAVEIEGDDVEENFEQFVQSEVAAGRISEEEADMILADTEGPEDGLDHVWDLVTHAHTDETAANDIVNRFKAAGFADADGNLLPNAVRMTAPTVDRFLRDEVAAGRITEEERVAIVSRGRDGLNNLISDANDRMTDINSQNEMMMIKLQSAMQNRTTILTSTTNLLKAMDEGNDAIVANLR